MTNIAFGLIFKYKFLRVPDKLYFFYRPKCKDIKIFTVKRNRNTP